MPEGTVWSSNAVTEQKREGIGAGEVVGIQMHKIATGWRQLLEGYRSVLDGRGGPVGSWTASWSELE